MLKVDLSLFFQNIVVNFVTKVHTTNSKLITVMLALIEKGKFY